MGSERVTSTKFGRTGDFRTASICFFWGETDAGLLGMESALLGDETALEDLSISVTAGGVRVAEWGGEEEERGVGKEPPCGLPTDTGEKKPGEAGRVATNLVIKRRRSSASKWPKATKG
ncbi:hypothetical protein MAMC_00425 [Methylacidimicrobium cyclopophantes]|uniref:Uncharacterized protein n=1 Tax=Methylacidimicrobium cyclopophantes TaxID=1041766 RepID=A0A5E6MBK9_9BACT|nr:hypothetical protein MAMC_00425 [Methylacidimicrobium cyclopophantes]